MWGQDVWPVYPPEQCIQLEASATKALTVKDDILYYRGEVIKIVQLSIALADFMEFIQTLSNPIMLGHNIKAFDLSVLYNSLKYLKIVGEFRDAMYGFVDTLKCAKTKIPQSDYQRVVGHTNKNPW